MLKISVYLVLTLLLSLVNSEVSNADSGLGPSCKEAKDGPEICTKELMAQIIAMTIKQVKLRPTQMSRYAKIFEKRQSQSGNCFTHADPTFAVNQGKEANVGKIVKITYNGKTKYGLTTDTGRMEQASGQARELDTTNSLFRSVGDLDDGVLDVKWGFVGSFREVIGYKLVGKGKKKRKIENFGVSTPKQEKIIACLKKINEEESNKVAKVAAKPTLAASQQRKIPVKFASK